MGIPRAGSSSSRRFPNGSLTYTPTANYNGSDSFTYKAYDGGLYSNVVTVSITVNSGKSFLPSGT